MISVETVPVLMNYGWSSPIDSEVAYTLFNGRSKVGKTWRLVFRVYLDGPYQEVPLEALPPIPAVQQSQNQSFPLPCCNIL